MEKEWKGFIVSDSTVNQLESDLAEMRFTELPYRLSGEAQTEARVWKDQNDNTIAVVKGPNGILVGSDWEALPIIHDLPR